MKKCSRIVDVAKRAGVSVYSVSLTLNDKADGEVSKDVQSRILAAAEELNYIKHRGALSLKTGRSLRVGLIIYGSLTTYPILGAFSLYEAISTISDYLLKKNYLVDIIQLKKEAGKEEWEAMISRNGSDGFILFGMGWSQKPFVDVLSVLRNQTVPSVLLNERSSGIACTYFNYKQAGYEAAKYLLQNKPSCMAVINAELSSKINRMKLTGIQKALKEFSSKTILKQVTIEKPLGFSSGFEAGVKLFSDPPYPETIFVTDNMAVPSLLLFLNEKRIKVPDDVEVLGLGDKTFAENNHPRFSYIPLMINEQSNAAAGMLLQMINEEKTDPEMFPAPITIVHNKTTNPNT